MNTTRRGARAPHRTERRAFCAAFSLILPLALAGCSSDKRPSLLGEDPDASPYRGYGGRSGGGGSGGLGGGGRAARDASVTDSATDAAPDVAASDGSADGPFDAGCTVPAAAPPGPTSGAVCSPSVAWGATTVIFTASTSGDDVFGSITPDQLTIVWMSFDGGAPTLHYADRSSPSDPFDPAGSIAAGQDYYASDRPAVSADGSRIVVVRSDRKGFGEYTRGGRYHAFDPTPSEVSFANLNNQGLTLASSEYFGDPLLSSDDLSFYYSKYGGGEVQTIFVSTRPAPVPWTLGSPVDGEPLRTACGHRRRATGISSDGLTLFYWDDASGTERATWRASSTGAFSGVVDLGTRRNAAPDTTCTKLYYSAPAADAASGGDDWVAAAP